MKWRALALAVPAGFGILASPASSFAAEPPLVTIHELKTNWQHYDGKRVCVRGQFDYCEQAWFCALCPEDMTPATYDWNRCISFGFANFHHGTDDRTTEHVDLVLREMYRFATVTVEANFSSLCLIGEDGNFVGGYICSDGGFNLDSATVLAVHSRKSVLDALGSSRPHEGALVPATPDEASAMASALPRGAEWELEPRMFAIVRGRDAIANWHHNNPALIADGAGCICIIDSCEGRWPSREAHLINSPANPFYCWPMEKRADGWHIVPTLEYL
jgi:hypothetical protein